MSGTTSTKPGSPALRPRQSRGSTPPAGAQKRSAMKSPYPTWFFIPAGVFYTVLFVVPTVASFYFALTRWTLFEVEFIGFDNFIQFFREPALIQGFVNTFIYAIFSPEVTIA